MDMSHYLLMRFIHITTPVGDIEVLITLSKIAYPNKNYLQFTKDRAKFTDIYCKKINMSWPHSGQYLLVCTMQVCVNFNT